MACLYCVRHHLYCAQWKLKMDRTHLWWYLCVTLIHSNEWMSALHAYNAFLTLFIRFTLLWVVLVGERVCFFRFDGENWVCKLKFDLISSSNYVVSICFDRKLIYLICCDTNRWIYSKHLLTFFDLRHSSWDGCCQNFWNPKPIPYFCSFFLLLLADLRI